MQSLIILFVFLKSECQSLSVSFHNVTEAISLATYSNFEDNGVPYVTIYKDLSSSMNYIWYFQSTGNNGSWSYQLVANIYDIYGQQYNASNEIASILPVILSTNQPDTPDDFFIATSQQTSDIITCYDDMWNCTDKCQIYLNEKQTFLPTQSVTQYVDGAGTISTRVLCMTDGYLIFWMSYKYNQDNYYCTDVNIMYDVWDLNGDIIQNDVVLINVTDQIGYHQCPNSYDGWKISEKEKNFVIEFEANFSSDISQTIQFISGFYTNLTDSTPAHYRLISPLSNTYLTTNTQYVLLDVIALNISPECCIISLYNNKTFESDWDEMVTYMSISDIFGINMFGDIDVFITDLSYDYGTSKILALSETIQSLFGIIYPSANKNTSNCKLIIQVYQLIGNQQISLNKIGSPQTIKDGACDVVDVDVLPQIIFNSNIHNDTSLFLTWSQHSSFDVVMVQSWNVSIQYAE